MHPLRAALPAHPLRAALPAGLLAAGLLAGGLAAARALQPPGPATVVIVIHHSRFEPAELRVAPGSTVRFLVRNTDPIDHEFILGDRAVQQRHERGGDAGHDGSVPGEISVPAGQERTTSYRFPAASAARPGGLEYACHLPGHYAYGMRGLVVLTRVRPDGSAAEFSRATLG